jgi:glycosyltransferase involved in cell wall biosynthesis
MSNKPLKILFDANALVNGRKSGVGHYTHYLVQSLATAYPDQVRLVGHYYDFLGRKRPDDLPQAPNIRYRVSRIVPGRAVNMLRRLGLSVPFELLVKTRGDILLFPNFLSQPSLRRKPIVATIHDLCFLAHPEFVSDLNLHDLQHYVPKTIKRSSLDLAVSEFTKQSLQEAYAVSSDRLMITPVPPLQKVEVSRANQDKQLKHLGIGKPYILFVGNLEPRKNLIGLIEAYSQLTEGLRSKHSLVLVGGAGWKNEDLLARIATLQAEGFDIITPGYVDDSQKAALYSQATLVVMPSFYEGFGMPILEAFQYGAPVAASDISVLHEAGGDGVAYFDPNQPTDIAAVIAQVLTDQKLRAKLVSEGTKQLAKYSWDKTAAQLYERLKGLN